ncbi:iron ABC transporter permease [Aureimonas sp. SA4125]|uniref:ABC transporter permease n=1 Tax=Aureimonas sp. SA4125 TaxID=2826993 RepID=UPI001CC47F3B|nr:iron ABC transporter permease [Aureimonas sp. SA4125]
MILCLGALPMGRIVVEALVPGGLVDLQAFAERLGKASALRATWHTLDTAFCGALIALALGTAFAVAVSMTDLPGKRTIGFLFLLPLMIAPQVTALAFLQLLGPSSALLGALGLAPPPGTANPLHGRGGIIWLYGIQHAPIVFITLRAGFARIPRDLTEASRASGAGAVATLRAIILPVAAPYFAAAAALAFVSGVGNFGIPALLGLPVNYLTLATLIYQKLSSFGPSVLPEVAALSTLIAGLALLGVACQSFALRRAGHRLGIGTPATFRLGPWRWPLGLAAWAVVALILVLPALALLSTALVPTVGVKLSLATVTLDNFAEVLTRQASTLRAFRNSFLLAGTAALLLAVIAVPLIVASQRFGLRWRKLLFGSLALAYAVPGIVLAIACILLFLRPLPLIGSLYGTAAIILVAYLMRFATLALQPVEASIGQISGDLTEAAAVAGAGPLRRLTTITAPLALPAAVAGALLVFMSAFNELTVSALLWSGGNETLGVVLFSLEEAGLASAAAAIAVSTVVVVVCLLIVLDRVGRRLPAGVLPWR